QQRADLVEHAPRGLVGDSKLALKLLRGDSAPSAGHEEDAVEPEAQRRSRVLEDRPGHRVFIVPAELAGVGRAGLYPMMLRHPAALRAFNPVRVQVLD